MDGDQARGMTSEYKGELCQVHPLVPAADYLPIRCHLDAFYLLRSRKPEPGVKRDLFLNWLQRPRLQIRYSLAWY